MKGGSIWTCPKTPNNKKLHTKKPNNNLEIGLKALPLIIDLSTIGNINKIKIAATIAITPPNLSGIALKIA